MIITLIHKIWGKECGEATEKKLVNWGKGDQIELSPFSMSCPQSYPPTFPLALQTVIRKSTGSTTTNTLINIY